MKPPVVSGGQAEGQLIILIVIFSHIDVKAVAADIVEGAAGDFLLFRAAFSADIAAFDKLLFNLRQILLLLGDFQ